MSDILSLLMLATPIAVFFYFIWKHNYAGRRLSLWQQIKPMAIWVLAPAAVLLLFVIYLEVIGFEPCLPGRELVCLSN